MKLTEKHSFGKITSPSPLDLDMRTDQPFEIIARTSPRSKAAAGWLLGDRAGGGGHVGGGEVAPGGSNRGAVDLKAT